MNKIKALLTSRDMYIGLGLGLLLGVAYGVKSMFVRRAASYLPGSATKPAPAAAE